MGRITEVERNKCKNQRVKKNIERRMSSGHDKTADLTKVIDCRRPIQNQASQHSSRECVETPEGSFLGEELLVAA